MENTLLDIVNQSPEACQAHDKAAWMALFDPYYILEDPVGSSPIVGGIYNTKDKRRGPEALSRFFETFIQPNQMHFEVRKDIVCGTHVVRDLNINVIMSETVKLSVPMHLIYELRESDNTYRFARLAAHWEFMTMIKQLLSTGSRCLPIVCGLTVRMLRYQGVSGTLGFSAAAFNIGKAGRQVAERFIDAVNDKDLPQLVNCFCHDEVDIHMSQASKPIPPSAFLDSCSFSKISFDKTIVAGDTVSISVRCDDDISGVAFFQFDRKLKKINQLAFYLS